ncbi:MAG: hypothetical protein JXQ99_03290 [Hyphomicrobiaceae bacterium]
MCQDITRSHAAACFSSAIRAVLVDRCAQKRTGGSTASLRCGTIVADNSGRMLSSRLIERRNERAGAKVWLFVGR